MVKVIYSIYSFYTDDNKIYVGLSNNVKLRICQHFRKSHNPRLRALIDDINTKVYAEILRTDLTYKEAYALEKEYIRRYTEDENYEVLNISCGGIKIQADNSKSENFSRRKFSKHYSDSEIEEIRKRCSKYGKIVATIDCKEFGLCPKYFMQILRGKARVQAPGPILGKDYSNG